MGKVHTRVIDDEVEVVDPDDRPEVEFCCIAHVHIRGRNMQEVLDKLAKHFSEARPGGDKDTSDFTAGHVTISRVEKVHGSPGEGLH